MQRQHGTSTDPRSPKSTMVQRSSSSSSKLLFLTSLIVLGTLVGFVRECKSESRVEEPPLDSEKGPFDCKRLMFRGAKAVMKTLSRCGREVKATTSSTKEFGDKIACVMKCAMFYSNMTTSDYKVTADSLKVMMVKFTPSAFMLHEIHSYMVARCTKEAAGLDPKDELCHSYAHYAICLQTGFEDFMNTSPYCLKKQKKNVE